MTEADNGMHTTDRGSTQHSPLTRDHSRASECGHAWLVLAHLPGLSSRRFNHLLGEFGSPDTILAADTEALTSAGLAAPVAARIRQAANHQLPDDIAIAVERAQTWAEASGHHILPQSAPQYPALLRDIPDPPPLLYVAGNLAVLQDTMLAMVGSRRPTVDGRRHARRFAGELSAAGMCISSGLAMGIDAESHAGTLARQGHTVAVLGTGIDVVYPSCNRSLFAELAAKGAIISEFNPGMPPRPENFPRRNRIISGLSLGVLVVEAGLKSGSMITARFALEQGRDVFAIPGSIHNPMTRGCHRLINEGARLVESPADILEECAQPYRTVAGENVLPEAGQHLGDELAQVLAVIGNDPVVADIVIRDTGLGVARVAAALVELEVLGLIHQQPGGFARRSPD